jgi:hypothetical protein
VSLQAVAGAKLNPELEGSERMDIAEAKAKLDAVLDELVAAGFSVWGWDDESIQIGQPNGPGAVCAPRHAVDDAQSG